MLLSTSSSPLQEKGEIWERWIKGIIRIKTDYETYSPYIFLTADTEDGQVNGFILIIIKTHAHKVEDLSMAMVLVEPQF